MMKTPVILTRNSESNTAAGMMPGAISIMQREHPLSPRSAVPSSGGLPTPSNPPPKQRDDYTKVLGYSSVNCNIMFVCVCIETISQSL